MFQKGLQVLRQETAGKQEGGGGLPESEYKQVSVYGRVAAGSRKVHISTIPENYQYPSGSEDQC